MQSVTEEKLQLRDSARNDSDSDMSLDVHVPIEYQVWLK